MPSPDLRIRVGKSSWDRSGLFQGDVWAAWCAACGTKLTDYDTSEQDARDIAESEMREHVCQSDQMTIMPMIDGLDG